jgi:hypothetical protein
MMTAQAILQEIGWFPNRLVPKLPAWESGLGSSSFL